MDKSFENIVKKEFDHIVSTRETVRKIMELVPVTRKDDYILYLFVCMIHANKMGIDLEKVSVYKFLSETHYRGFPVFETVRRSRQNIQEKIPELAAGERCKTYRRAKEEAFRAFSRGE